MAIHKAKHFLNKIERKQYQNRNIKDLWIKFKDETILSFQYYTFNLSTELQTQN